MKRLGDIAQVTMGQSPPGYTYNTERVGLPFFQGKAEFGDVSPTPVKWCSEPNRVAEEGDILLSVRAPVGPTNYANARCCIGRGLAAIRGDSQSVNQKYLGYFLKRFETDLGRQGVGSTFTAINRRDIESLELPVPPLAEQERIVTLLDEADAIMKLRARADQRTADLIPALFHEMFVNETRTLRLDEVAEVVSGVTKGRKLDGQEVVEVPYLRVANVQAGFLDLSELKTIPASRDEVDRLAVRPGDVLMTEGGDFDKLGRGAMLEHEISNCIHQNHVFRVRTDPCHLLPVFFASYLQTTTARQYFLSCAKKTTNLASMNMTQLRSLPVVVPPLAIQKGFETRVSEVRAMEASQSFSHTSLSQVAQSVLHRVFTEGV